MENFVESKYVLKLPLATIEQQFGTSNFDDCYEEVQYMIIEIFGSADFEMQCDFETTHFNPYFHMLNFEISGIDGVTFGLVENELRKRKLLFES